MFHYVKSEEDVEKLKEEGKIREICEGVYFGSFGNERILTIAPHSGLIKIDLNGKKVQISELATDVLAMLAAKAVNGSFLFSKIPRVYADFARDPALLGKGLTVNLRPNGVKMPVPVHTKEEYRECLEKWHDLIEKINPLFIIAYHAMHNRIFDISLGFGKKKQYIGGKENAFRFREEVKKIAGDLKIAVGKRLTGESEFNLKSHVKGNRFGVLAEFNSKGLEPHKKFHKIPYQKAAEAIAIVAERWLK